MIVNIRVRNDGDGFFIGSVVTPEGMTEDNARESVNDLWHQWKEDVPYPDCDSDFILYLMGKGWQEDMTDSITIYFD